MATSKFKDMELKPGDIVEATLVSLEEAKELTKKRVGVCIPPPMYSFFEERTVKAVFRVGGGAPLGVLVDVPDEDYTLSDVQKAVKSGKEFLRISTSWAISEDYIKDLKRISDGAVD